MHILVNIYSYINLRFRFWCGLFVDPFWPLQEPRHLQFFASFSDSDVYTVLSAKKLHGAPSDYSFCVKVPSLVWTFQKRCWSWTRVDSPELCFSSPQSAARHETWSCCVPMTNRAEPAGWQRCACWRSVLMLVDIDRKHAESALKELDKGNYWVMLA